MALQVNKLQYKFYPAYNPAWYILEYKGETVEKVNYIYLKDLFNTSFITAGIIELRLTKTIDFIITNDYIREIVQYSIVNMPNKYSDLPFMAINFDPVTPNMQKLEIDMLAALNSWSKILNSSLVGNYFNVSVEWINTTPFVDIDFLTNPDLINDWVLKFVPKFVEDVRFDALPQSNLPTEWTVDVNTSVITSPNITKLKQPRIKLNVYTNDSKFPDITNVTNPIKILEEYIPVVKRPVTDDFFTDYTYDSNFDLNMSLKKFVKTLLPVTGGIRIQNKWLFRYWFDAIEEGTVVVRGTGNSLIESTTRSVVDIELNKVTSEPRYVSNSARDLLNNYSTSIYYRDNDGCTDSGGFDGANLVNFLTDQPKQKETYYCKDSACNEKEYLSFITEIPNVSIKANVLVTFRDGSTTTLSKTYKEKSVEGQAVTIDVSPEVLGIDKLTNQDIYKWEVSINLNDQPYTVTQEYIRKPCGLPNTFNIIFLNQLGMWDSFTFVGDNNSQADYKTNTFRSNLTPQTISSSRIVGNFNTSFTDGYDLNSGYVNKEHYEWLKQLAASNEIYVVVEGKLQSYVLKSVDYKFDSFRSLYTVGIKINRTIEFNNVNNR